MNMFITLLVTFEEWKAYEYQEISFIMYEWNFNY